MRENENFFQLYSPSMSRFPKKINSNIFTISFLLIKGRICLHISKSNAVETMRILFYITKQVGNILLLRLERQRHKKKMQVWSLHKYQQVKPSLNQSLHYFSPPSVASMHQINLIPSYGQNAEKIPTKKIQGKTDHTWVSAMGVCWQ